MKQQQQAKNIYRKSNTVLLLGNGISRLEWHNYIKAFKGEVWGCNLVFKDYGYKLTRITGHMEFMALAKEVREKYNFKYKIYGGHILGSIKDKEFTCLDEFKKDSGTTLLAQALHEKRKVYLVGFDLGGHDIYSPEHHKQNKSNWINNWRSLIKHYGHEDINFVGHNHLPFLLSNKDPHTYYDKYSENKEGHIPTEEYKKALIKFKAKYKVSNYEKQLEVVRKFYKTLVNVSNRVFTLKVEGKEYTLPKGESIKLPEHDALYYVKNYKREFEILKEVV